MLFSIALIILFLIPFVHFQIDFEGSFPTLSPFLLNIVAVSGDEPDGLPFLHWLVSTVLPKLFFPLILLPIGPIYGSQTML